MEKFPKIRQFCDAIASVKYKHRDDDQLPTLTFEGSVKLHGTNSAIIFHPNGKVEYQSRNRTLTLNDDNHGFVSFCEDQWGAYASPLWDKVRRTFSDQLSQGKQITIFGEFCGGNIQSGIALSQLKKMFVVFAIRFGEGKNGFWASPFQLSDLGAQLGMYSVKQLGWGSTVKIDFNAPGESIAFLDAQTSAVEEQCPAGSHFGVSGIGEGIVWTCIDEGYESSDFWFKVKGAKHAGERKKTKTSIRPEQLESIEDFINATITESRLNQGIDFLRETSQTIDQTRTGDFIRWVSNDVRDEESTVLGASGLTMKDIGRSLSRRARVWFLNKTCAIA